MSLQYHLAFLKKQKTFIVVFCVSAILSSLALTYIFSERYLAATTIIYRPLGKTLLRSEEMTAFGMPVPVPAYDSINQKLNDAVKNDVILRPVVEQLHLDQEVTPAYSAWYERWYYETKKFTKKQLVNLWCILKYGRIIEEDPTTAAIRDLQENIGVTSTKETNIFVLSVKDKYPQRAAAIIDLAGQLLVEWIKNEQLHPAKSRLLQLDEDITEKQDEISNLQKQTEDLLQAKNFVSLEDDTAKGLQNLYEMELERVRVNSQINEKEKEITEYDQSIKDGIRKHISGKDIDSMKSTKLFEMVKLEGLKEKNKYLTASIGKLKGQLQELPMMKTKLDDIDIKIESAKRDLLNMKDLRLAAQDQVQTGQVEARILHPAVILAKPVQPIKIYHVGLTAMLSLLLSLALVYVLDFLRIRTFFDTDEQIEAEFESPGLLTYSPSSQVEQQALFLQKLASNLTAESGSLFLLENNNLVRVKSLDPGHAPAVIPVQRQQGSLFHKALQTGEPVLIEDINKAEGVEGSSWPGYKNSSLLVLPIFDSAQKIIGVVSLHNKVSPPFTQRDLQVGVEMLSSFPSVQSLERPALPLNPHLEIADQSERASSSVSFRPLHPFLRIPSIMGSGALIAIAVYYLLKKLGY